MAQKWNNYDIQMAQAKKHFLTYNQKELIDRCRLRFDEAYFYIRFLGRMYRLCRTSGDLQRLQGDIWIDANSFGEVMTILDWLCDSRADRYVTGRWINIVTHGHYFHRNLQEEADDPAARFFDAHSRSFGEACRSLGGEAMPGGDQGYVIELIDGLKVYLQLWHGDEEFPPRLTCLWDENTTRYIRYETTWYVKGFLMGRLMEKGRQFAGQE